MKKKFITNLLILSMSTGALISPLSNDVVKAYANEVVQDGKAARANKTGVITANVLNVRQAASTGSSVLGTLKKGATVTIIGESGAWYQISYQGKNAYVSKEYVNVQGETKTGTIKVSSVLNVRSGAGTGYSVIGTLKNGAKVNITGESNGFYQIDFNGKKGYVSKEYVQVSTSSNSGSSNSGGNTQVTVIGTGTVTTDVLNVRKGAGTNYGVIGTVKRGDKLQVIEKLSNGWLKIKFGSGTGYVSASYVTVSNSGSSNSGTTQTVIGTGVITTDVLNVRNGASTNNSLIGTVNKGTTVDVLEKLSNGWLKIKFKDGVGYVSGDYVKYTPNSVKPEEKPEVKPEEKPEQTPEVKPEEKPEQTPEVKPEEKPEDNKPAVNETGIVNTDVLNVRSGAGTNNNIIGTLTRGAKVEILEKLSNGWLKIKFGNGTGYVSGDYIKISSNETTPDVKPEGQYITTQYNMSMDDYIALQFSRVPSNSVMQYEQYINPENASNQFQFLRIDNYRNIDGKKLNDYLEKKDAGVLKGQANAFIASAKEYNIDPIYFVAQSIHETGYGKSRLAMGVEITEIADPNKPINNEYGKLVGYEMIKLDEPVTVYNLYGIGAYDNTPEFPNRALILGTTYAYNQGWTSVEAAIEGAANFVAKNYIHHSVYKQNTPYKMRYTADLENIWHQYATTPWYASSIGDQMNEMKDIYTVKESEFIFDKPVFVANKSFDTVMRARNSMMRFNPKTDLEF